MMVWILILIGLLIFQNIGLNLSFPIIYIQLTSLAMLLCILGMAYQIYAKQKELIRKEDESKRDHQLLGQILTSSGFCTADELLEGLNLQSKGDARRIGEILIDMKVITEEQLERALSIQDEIRNGATN